MIHRDPTFAPGATARARHLACAAFALTVASAGCAPGSVVDRFLASLRIPKPEPVSAQLAGAGANNPNGQVQDVVAAIVGRDVSIPVNEADEPAATVAAAEKAAQFAPRVPFLRTDPPTVAVLGAHTIRLTVDASQMRTVMAQAGESMGSVPAGLDGAALTIATPRGIRLQYGHCPVAAPQTLQGQLQGPPPASTDNADCIVLVERPGTTAPQMPSLDMPRLVGIALEVGGMTPLQARDFQRRVPWTATLSLSMPRNTRSYDTVLVGADQGLLFGTGGRRGPTYTLIWSSGTLVNSLTGYGNPIEGPAIAASMR